MYTQIINIDDENFDEEDLKEAGKVILENGTVAFPTETVYGLGANALSEEAIKKIFIAKGRPSDNPLIVHIANINDLRKLVKEVPNIAKILIEKFWPGPLTIIFKKSEAIPKSVTAGLDTVAIRMPNHKIALSLINSAGVPIAAPSANLSGKPSPTAAEHVVDDLNGRVDVIICGGESIVGLESTVLDLSGETPMILRPGGITSEQIKSAIGTVLLDPYLLKDQVGTPKSPGMKYTHYSPDAELIVFSGDKVAVLERINSISNTLRKNGKKVGIMTCDENFDSYLADEVISLGSIVLYEDIAKNLFFTLREFDKLNVDVILSESFELLGIGSAIMNRLKKAAGNNIIEV